MVGRFCSQNVIAVRIWSGSWSWSNINVSIYILYNCADILKRVTHQYMIGAHSSYNYINSPDVIYICNARLPVLELWISNYKHTWYKLQTYPYPCCLNVIYTKTNKYKHFNHQNPYQVFSEPNNLLKRHKAYSALVFHQCIFFLTNATVQPKLQGRYTFFCCVISNIIVCVFPIN